jgi:Tfp pilus assembly protein PilP
MCGRAISLAILVLFIFSLVLESRLGAAEKMAVPKMGAALEAQSGSIDPMEEIRQTNRFRYNSFGRRDPFLSFVKPAEEVSKVLPPLQQADLSQMKLVGVAWGSGGYGAMIQVSAGKTYSVKVGTRVGTNNGRVKEIGQKEIVVEEPFLNIFGRSDLKRVVMKLYPKKEGIE